jgi:ABC-type Zn2+ transport system substrate-binding protein/surface adhesin
MVRPSLEKESFSASIKTVIAICPVNVRGIVHAKKGGVIVAVCKKIVVIFLLVLVASLARADDGLLFSVRPLAFLHAALRPEAATPAVLIPGAMDPHHYTLTVADMARLRQAQLLFWLGSTNEPYLARLAGGRSGTPIWIAIGGNQPFGESAQAMAAALSQRYPAEAASIQTRADQLLQARKKQEEFWRQQLAPFTQQHFLLGHNALLPLVEGLGLQGARIYQAESGHGHAQGGMQELLTLQQEVASGKIRCAIEEPGIRFQALAKKHPGLRLAYIEPMGGNLAITPDASLTLFNTTAAALQKCLAGEKK